MCPTWTCQSAWFWFCWTEQTSRPRRCRFEFIRSLQRGLQEYIYQPERCISGFKKSVSHHSNEEITCLNLDLSPKCCKQWKQEQEPVHKASLDLKTYRLKVLQWRRGSGASTSVTYSSVVLMRAFTQSEHIKEVKAWNLARASDNPVCWVECVKVLSRLWNCEERNCRSGGFIFSFL